MPKISKTRKLKAIELLQMAEKGPCFIMTFFHLDHFSLSPEQRTIIEDYITDQYRIWSSTWLVPPIKALVPELKELKMFKLFTWIAVGLAMFGASPYAVALYLVLQWR